MTHCIPLHRHRMYIWNNIFFSLASDGRDHYKEFGGDEAAHAASVSRIMWKKVVVREAFLSHDVFFFVHTRERIFRVWPLSRDWSQKISTL